MVIFKLPDVVLYSSLVSVHLARLQIHFRSISSKNHGKGDFFSLIYSGQIQAFNHTYKIFMLWMKINFIVHITFYSKLCRLSCISANVLQIIVNQLTRYIKLASTLNILSSNCQSKKKKKKVERQDLLIFIFWKTGIISYFLDHSQIKILVWKIKKMHYDLFTNKSLCKIIPLFK